MLRPGCPTSWPIAANKLANRMLISQLALQGAYTRNTHTHTPFGEIEVILETCHGMSNVSSVNAIVIGKASILLLQTAQKV